MLGLKELRESHFLSQADLAQKAGVSKDTINRLESGKQRPTLQTICKLAKALGVEPRVRRLSTAVIC